MTSAKLNLTILLGAVPDPTYAPTSHRGSVLITAREFLVSSLDRAVETLAVFMMDNALGPVNVVGAGLVRLDGEPLCRVTAEGKLLAVDSEGRAIGLSTGTLGCRCRSGGTLGSWFASCAKTRSFSDTT